MKWSTITQWSLPMLLMCLLFNSIQEGDGWPMFQHDPQHTGYSPSKMPESLKEIWINERPSVLSGPFAVLVISEGNLFLRRYFSLSALDITTGSVRWNLERLHESLNFPAVKNDRLYISETQKIVCLDANTGDVLWEHIVELLEFSSSPIVIDNYIIVGGGETNEWNPDHIEVLERAMRYAHRVMCLNAETGELVWEFYANNWVVHSPVFLDDKVYINDRSQYIYCLDVKTGELIWEKMIEWTNASSLSVDGERIFVGTSSGFICLDHKTGDPLWKFKCKGHVYETPAVAYNKVFGPVNEVFYCLDVQTGELIWKREAESVITSTIVVADEKVAFGTRNGILHIVNAKSGKMCESLQLDNSPIMTLALSDGKLFVGQENGKITCFESSSNKLINSAFFPFEFSAIYALALAVSGIVLVWYLIRKRCE